MTNLTIQIVEHYVCLGILALLVIGFPVMIIYGVVLYFKCKKIPAVSCDSETMDIYCSVWDDPLYEDDSNLDDWFLPCGVACHMHRSAMGDE